MAACVCAVYTYEYMCGLHFDIRQPVHVLHKYTFYTNSNKLNENGANKRFSKLKNIYLYN